MKPKLLILIALSLITIENFGQFSFGVSPGIGLNSAYFGYRVNEKLVPFIGFQYVHAKFNYEESGERFDYDLNRVDSYSETNELSGGLYVPNIGVKYFIKDQNKLQAYLLLNLTKPIVSGKMKYDGEEDEDFNDIVKALKIWGGEFGFGMEYFLDENFSIGGEFGLRYLHLKYDDTRQTDYYDPNTDSYVDTEIRNYYKYSMNPTYSRISLNFYL